MKFLKIKEFSFLITQKETQNPKSIRTIELQLTLSIPNTGEDHVLHINVI